MVYSRNDFIVDSFYEGDHFGDYCILDKQNQFEYRSNDLTTCLLIPETVLFEVLLQSEVQLKKTMTRALSRYRETVKVRKEIRRTINTFMNNADGNLSSEELFFKIQKHMNAVFPMLKPSEKYENPAFIAFEEKFEQMFKLADQPILTTVGDELLNEHDTDLKDYESLNVKNPFLRKLKGVGTATTASPNVKNSGRGNQSKRPLTSEYDSSRFQKAMIVVSRSKGQGPKLSKERTEIRKRVEVESPRLDLDLDTTKEIAPAREIMPTASSDIIETVGLS